jgi:hypothetical protein
MTEQFFCPVDGCVKSCDSYLEFANHIQIMLKNGREDHSHLMNIVDHLKSKEEKKEAEQ